jgi:hypothetical protein
MGVQAARKLEILISCGIQAFELFRTRRAHMISVDLTFKEKDKIYLQDILLKLENNPYSNYEFFEEEVDDVINRGEVPAELVRLCEARKNIDTFANPYIFIHNCPIDPHLPYLDFKSPVIDKRIKKLSYVAEGFLLIYAKLMSQEPIGYVNVNDGDVFQDIHPMESLCETQSQKALNDIYFHKDLANHYVRPDWVNIIGLRGCEENEVYTCFASNQKILADLPENIKALLRESEFNTPFDDLTTISGNLKMGSAPDHPVLGGATDYDIRYFECRTVGTTERARGAIEVLNRTLHSVKTPIHVLPGVFIGSANNECIHNKEVRLISNPQELRNRWLMKAVNVNNLDQHAKHVIPGKKRIIAG